MEGKPVEAGPWDTYILYAERYGWSPDVVAGLDPEFVDELALYWRAQSDSRKALREETRR